MLICRLHIPSNQLPATVSLVSSSCFTLITDKVGRQMVAIIMGMKSRGIPHSASSSLQCQLYLLYPYLSFPHLPFPFSLFSLPYPFSFPSSSFSLLPSPFFLTITVFSLSLLFSASFFFFMNSICSCASVLSLSL